MYSYTIFIWMLHTCILFHYFLFCSQLLALFFLLLVHFSFLLYFIFLYIFSVFINTKKIIFLCSFILSKTATWGYLKNGKFDGMIGALVRKQADIGGSPIFFRIERAKVIDYTTRTWVARYE